MKLAFLGTSEFAVPALEALVEAGHDVVAVYTRAPKPAGRGQQERRTPVHELALSLSLAVRTPKSLRSEEEAASFKALDLDAAVVVSYGHILPKALLDAPVLGCINIHGSLLPRWRGAAPIHRAVLAGDAETGVTTLRMDEGLDTGPMLLAESTPISAADTAETVHDRLAELGGRLIVSTLDALVAKTIEPVPQPDDGVTYAHKLGKEEGALDWRRPAAELDRVVRAFRGRTDAFTHWGGQLLKVLAARPTDLRPADHQPGEVFVPPGGQLAKVPHVVAGAGSLALLRVALEGRSATAGQAFLNGYPAFGSARLSTPQDDR
jgi:methionyl-tRNA formyltransferase